VAGDTAAYTWGWNSDLILASMYHSSDPTTTVVTDGTSWCSKWFNTLDGYSEVVLTASKGFSGKNKCTY